MDTRPTLDRVRESLFNILAGRLAGARVLDLFAGSGALGLEALSRGADAAVFVDSARAAQEAVSRNIQAVGVAPRARLLRMDWQRALSTLAAEGAAFDLIFLDPPYAMAQAPQMFARLHASGLLAGDGCVVYEHDHATPPDGTGWLLLDRRHYRGTDISFYRIAGGSDAHSALPRQL